MKKKYFHYTLFVIFLGILLLEFSLRLYFSFSDNDIKALKRFPGRYISSYFTGYKLNPNWELNHQTFQDKINSIGLKSPEIAIKKQNNTYRIICIGGSLVYGKDIGTSWPHYLQMKLNERMREQEINFEVINAGVPGYTSFHSIADFMTKLIDLEPDMVIMYQLFTDLYYYEYLDKELIIGDTFNPYNTNLSIDRLMDKSYIYVIIGALKRKFLSSNNDNEKILNSERTKVFQENDLKYYERNVNIMASLSSLLNYKLLFCPPISLFKNENTLEEKAIIADIKSKQFYLDYISNGKKLLKKASENNMGVYYFDLSTKFTPSIDYLSDRYHPTVKGNKKIANEIFKFLYENKILKL